MTKEEKKLAIRKKIMERRTRLKEDYNDMGPAVVSPDDQIMDPAANVKPAKSPVATNPVTGSKSLMYSSDKPVAGDSMDMDADMDHDMDEDEAKKPMVDADMDADGDHDEAKEDEVVSFAEALRRLREADETKDKGKDEDDVVFSVDEAKEDDCEEEGDDCEVNCEMDDLSEDINAMTEGQDLPESFKTKATAIFHAAVKRNVTEQVNRLSKAYDGYVKGEIRKAALRESIQKKLAAKRLDENADRYLTYVAEEWLKENRIAVETGLRVQLAEEFMSKVKTALEESMIEVPANKVNLVEKLEGQVNNLKKQLSQQIESNVTLKEKYDRTRRDAIVHQLSEGLAASQAAKLRVLTEGLKWTSQEDFTKNVREIRESYFKTNKATVAKPLTEQVQEAQVKSPAVLNEKSNVVDIYAQALSKKRV